MTRKENISIWIESIGTALFYCVPLGLCVLAMFFFLCGGEVWP
ncbi:hypothetical protein TOTORO_01080 [Serratia phage vB_SmaS-Totoro]|nr:hypothetical protein TOTORO_01080 [Serratia phage vB_SmaS-Totoro]